MALDTERSSGGTYYQPVCGYHFTHECQYRHLIRTQDTRVNPSITTLLTCYGGRALLLINYPIHPIASIRGNK